MAQGGIGGTAREQVRVFLKVAREHHQHLLPAFGQFDQLLDAIRPVGFAAQMVDDHHTRMLEHIADVKIDRCRLPQKADIGEPDLREAGAEPRHHARQQRQRRVGRTQHHDLSRSLIDPDDAFGIVDKTARNGA
jgi:hypothetical protein